MTVNEMNDMDKLMNRPTVAEIFGPDYVSADVKLVQRLDALIEQTYKENRDLEYYGRQLNVSLRQLNRLVFWYHGKTVHQRLQDRIHREAEKLLKHTLLTSKEISNELGLCDQAHFCKCFKKRTGLTPIAYRKMNQVLVKV